MNVFLGFHPPLQQIQPRHLATNDLRVKNSENLIEIKVSVNLCAGENSTTQTASAARVSRPFLPHATRRSFSKQTTAKYPSRCVHAAGAVTERKPLFYYYKEWTMTSVRKQRGAGRRCGVGETHAPRVYL